MSPRHLVTEDYLVQIEIQCSREFYLCSLTLFKIQDLRNSQLKLVLNILTYEGLLRWGQKRETQGTDKNQGLACILQLLVSPLAKHGEGIDWHFIGHANIFNRENFYPQTFRAHQIWFYMLFLRILSSKGCGKWSTAFLLIIILASATSKRPALQEKFHLHGNNDLNF